MNTLRIIFMGTPEFAVPSLNQDFQAWYSKFWCTHEDNAECIHFLRDANMREIEKIITLMF